MTQFILADCLQMDIVLDLAHMKDNVSSLHNSVPSKDRMLDQIVFSATDVVMITAHSVDLDFVSKGDLNVAGGIIIHILHIIFIMQHLTSNAAIHYSISLFSIFVL